MTNYIKHDINQNTFYIEGKDSHKGYVKYNINKNIMDITSTFVDPNYRNHGYAKKLVDAAVEYAKDQQLKLNPTCSYADKVIKKYYPDMLA